VLVLAGLDGVAEFDPAELAAPVESLVAAF